MAAAQGRWICDNCTFQNNAALERCEMCWNARQETGRSASNRIVTPNKHQQPSKPPREKCTLTLDIYQIIFASILIYGAFHSSSVLNFGMWFATATTVVIILRVLVMVLQYAERYLQFRSVPPGLWILFLVFAWKINRMESHFEAKFATLGKVVAELKEDVHQINATVAELSIQMDARYNESMNQYGWVKTIDDMGGYINQRVTALFGVPSIRRRLLGWGCFEGGTRIQVDEFGRTVRVEKLRNGDVVYNPVLRKKIRIKMCTYGEESGVMYQFVTADSMSVLVTETHPMKICVRHEGSKHVNETFECERNIAAKDMSQNDWTVTRSGYQQIVSIRQIAVQKALVYNFMFDLPDDTSISTRTVVANGIHTLDLHAQRYHHLEKDMRI